MAEKTTKPYEWRVNMKTIAFDAGDDTLQDAVDFANRHGNPIYIYFNEEYYTVIVGKDPLTAEEQEAFLKSVNS